MPQELVFDAPRRGLPPRHFADLDADERLAAVTALGLPGFRAKQIANQYYGRLQADPREMTDLPAAVRDAMSEALFPPLLSVVRQVQCDAGDTRKTLWRGHDGATFESVLMRYPDRNTVCISSQAGCGMACPFCATGQGGLTRNLSTAEIVEQVRTAAVACRDEFGGRLSNVVFMGMGEPLANLDAVADAVTCLTDHTWGLGISARRITISTAGLASRIKDVAPLKVNLAISLNATTDDLRQQIMPAANRLHSIQALLAACRAYPLGDRDRLTFEYVLLAEVNDRAEDATRLVKLLRDLRCKVNLIAFNPFPGSAYRRPSDVAIDAFQAILRRGRLDVYLRRSRGRDVLGACGQLGRLETGEGAVALTQIQARC